MVEELNLSFAYDVYDPRYDERRKLVYAQHCLTDEA